MIDVADSAVTAAPPSRRFRAESDERWDLVAIERRVLASQRERRLVARALAQGAHTPWDFQPFTDASVSYVAQRRGRASPHRPPASRRRSATERRHPGGPIMRA